MKKIISVAAIAVGLAGSAVLTGGVAQAEQQAGCSVSRPDAHIVAERKVDVDYLFTCNNARIRYVKATLNIRQHRGGAPDKIVKSYQFDDFRDPRRAAINGSLQSDGPCSKGKKYHGDITINVILNADQHYSQTLRGNSVKCP